jgi:hypothetical protein
LARHPRRQNTRSDHDLDASELEEFAQLICVHAHDREDVTEGSFGHVAAGISRAITDNALVFIACFSSHSAARANSYQNEELTLAIEQFRLRPPDARWLIPVRFDDCQVPRLSLGAGRTLD